MTVADSPTFSNTIQVSGPNEVAMLQFSVLCSNIPAGAAVAFSAAAPNDGGPGFEPIVLPWVQVPNPVGGKPGDIVPTFIVGMHTPVIANYQSDLTYEYQANGYPTPQGFRITMQVLLMAGGDDGGTALIIGTHTTVLPDQN